MMKVTCFLLFLTSSLGAQQIVQLASPNGELRFQFHLTPQAPVYSITFQGHPVIEDSELHLDFREAAVGKSLKVKRVHYDQKDETYPLVVGKTSLARNHYRAATIELVSTQAPFWQVNLVVRAYDDGFAFRYEFPKQPKWKTYEMLDEHSTFRFAANPTVYTLLRKSYTTSHEGLYTTTTLDSLPGDQLMDLPTLFKFSDSLYVSITEAALSNYAGMYLQKTVDRTLTSKLSPLPGQTEVKVKALLPHRSPWRVVIVADHVGQLIESNILTNLNEPCRIQDLSWIKPGKTTWTWWNGDVIKNVDFPVGQNFETHKYYIDWCAANHIEYHSIIEHGNWAWYQGDTEGFDPPPAHADVTKPVASLDMERLAAYSREKGVGLRVWVHWKPLSEKLDEAFAQYEKWNIKGLMIDFMDRDDQQMVNWQEKVLQTAAKYHLHVQFHGAYKPTGMSRTYPNEFTREGVMNLETFKGGPECDPEHNLMVPFTRMLAGPMDYHLGGFRSSPRSHYHPSFIEPEVLGTRCHFLAMYVVFENYLQMVSDYPQAYDGQPGFEFIQEIPTTWDETRVLAAEVGNYLVIARRKGPDWYLGAMSDWTARKLEIPLDFLSDGEYTADIFSDAADADANPNHLDKTIRIVRNSDRLTVKLTSGGGQAIWLRPKK